MHKHVDGTWSETTKSKLCHILDNQDSDVLLILKSGQVVFSYGDIRHKYLCHSMRKSFLAALIGQDVHEGRIDLSLNLAELGIDDNDGLSELEKRATLYDLLTARSGVYHKAGYETEWMRSIKEQRHSHGPGTFWCYNNWDFNALGTIFSQLSGLSVMQAFQQRLAEPLGMEDFSLAGEQPDGWYDHFEESCHPAYPFRLSSRDLARFGQLFLNKGQWQGQQILPQGWVEECTLPYSDAGTRGAYGYMWWLERDGVFFPGAVSPRGSFAALGVGGHYCLVMPALDMVVIHRVDTDVPNRQINHHQFGRLLKIILSSDRDIK